MNEFARVSNGDVGAANPGGGGLLVELRQQRPDRDARDERQRPKAEEAEAETETGLAHARLAPSRRVWQPRILLDGPGFGHEGGGEDQPAHGDRGKIEESARIAEPLDDEARSQIAEAGADPDRQRHKPLRQIETAGPPHEVIGDDDRDHAENPGCDAVERLDGDHGEGIGVEQGEQPTPHRQHRQHDQEDGLPTAAGVESPADGERGDGHHELRHDDASAQRQGVCSGVLARQNLARHRQHRGVAEVEQDDCAKEDEQVAIQEDIAQAYGLAALRSRPTPVGAARQAMVDVARADAEHGRDHADRKDAHQIEHPAVAPGSAARADQDGGGKGSGMAERLIPGELRRHPPMSNKAEAKRGERRGQHGRCGADRDLRAHHPSQLGADRDRQTSGHGDQRRCGDERPLDAQRVDQHAGRDLTHRAGDIAHRHRHADVARVPVARALEKHRQIGTQAVLHVGHQKIQPIERPEASASGLPFQATPTGAARVDAMASFTTSSHCGWARAACQGFLSLATRRWRLDRSRRALATAAGMRTFRITRKSIASWSAPPAAPRASTARLWRPSDKVGEHRRRPARATGRRRRTPRGSAPLGRGERSRDRGPSTAQTFARIVSVSRTT